MFGGEHADETVAPRQSRDGVHFGNSLVPDTDQDGEIDPPACINAGCCTL